MEETSTDSRRVKPNFNKNAQRILHEHFNRSSHQQSSGALSARTSADLPVLAKLDSSAPKSARSHDISYRLERPNFLAPRVPPSLIPKEMLVQRSLMKGYLQACRMVRVHSMFM